MQGAKLCQVQNYERSNTLWGAKLCKVQGVKLCKVQDYTRCKVVLGLKPMFCQRMGYSTVTRLEQPVYLAVWKEAWEHSQAALRTNINRMYYFQCLEHLGPSWNIGPSWDNSYPFSYHFLTICLPFLDHIPTIPDHFPNTYWPSGPFLVWLNYYWIVLN